MKIKIYAPSETEANKLAAVMCLALRHWEYVGAWDGAPTVTWADVGAVMEEYQELQHRMEGLEK